MSFVEMGGYAAYVWPAFGATAVVLTVLVATSLRSLRVRKQILEGLQRDGEAGRVACGRKSAT